MTAPLVWLPADLITRVRSYTALRIETYPGPQGLRRQESNVEIFVLPHPADAGSLDLVSTMRRLKFLQALSSGVDHVIAAVPEHVPLFNAPSLHARATAETAMSLLLASLNNVPAWSEAQRRGVWSDPGPRVGLVGKTVAILGFGAVGQALAGMLAGFDVRVLPVARRSRPGVHGVVDLPELVGGVDVLVVSVPLSHETRGLVDQDLLGRMKDGSLLINVARGPVVDSDALLAEVSSGRLRAGLDVVDPEPLPDGHPLWACPGVLISPHVGGNTRDFWDRAAAFVDEQLERFVLGSPLRHPVERTGQRDGQVRPLA